MFDYFLSNRRNQLDPPIQFDNQSCHFQEQNHALLTSAVFIRVLHRIFYFQATNWWNSLPDTFKEYIYLEIYNEHKLAIFVTGPEKTGLIYM